MIKEKEGAVQNGWKNRNEPKGYGRIIPAPEGIPHGVPGAWGRGRPDRRRPGNALQGGSRGGDPSGEESAERREKKDIYGRKGAEDHEAAQGKAFHAGDRKNGMLLARNGTEGTERRRRIVIDCDTHCNDKKRREDRSLKYLIVACHTVLPPGR